MIDIHEALQNLAERGHEKARTKAYHTTQDRLRKEVRAHCMRGAIHAGSTIGKAEQLALTDPGYVAQCERCEQAEHAMILAAVEYDVAQATIEAWRSLQATARAEMGLQ